MQASQRCLRRTARTSQDSVLNLLFRPVLHPPSVWLNGRNESNRHVIRNDWREQENGKRAMALGIFEVREIVERVFAQQDVLDACARRDLGRVIMILGAQGLTQGRISELTGISQGRLSEWARRKRKPRASSVFEAFADGLGVPPAAREALGLASDGFAEPRLSQPHLARDRIAPPTPPPPPISPQPTRVPAEGLAALLYRETVQGPLNEVMAALKAQQSRRACGSTVRRPVWKNLVFTGGPGTGRSRAAVAVGQDYRKLGVLATGHVIEAAAADLVGASPAETGKLVAEAVRPASGGILMINAAHDWQRLPDHGQQVLRRLYEQLTEYRNERRDELAMILAGQAGRCGSLLHASPSLAARFRAFVDFPGFTPGQLTVIFGSLADEAGLTLTPAAESKVAAVLAQAEGGHGSGNARLAVRLLNQATAIQALRVAAASAAQGRDPAGLHTLSAADIPDQLPPEQTPPEENWPGQYLLPAVSRRQVPALASRRAPAPPPPPRLACQHTRVFQPGTVPRQVIQWPLAVDETGERAMEGGGLVLRSCLDQAVGYASWERAREQPFRLVRGAEPFAVLGPGAQHRGHVGCQCSRTANHRGQGDRCLHRVGDSALARPGGKSPDGGQDFRFGDGRRPAS